MLLLLIHTHTKKQRHKELMKEATLAEMKDGNEVETFCGKPLHIVLIYMLCERLT